MKLNAEPRRIEHVVIVGAGFSGSLQAINLVRHGGPAATLIERRPHAGRGVAYSAAHPDHLLNVRAANMSALPDEPDHFARWLAVRYPGLSGFAPRIVYGEYLDELLDGARNEAGGRLTLRRNEAIDVRFDSAGGHVLLDSGEEIRADTLILAPGNLPPHEPERIAAAGLDRDHYVSDPWTGDLSEGLSQADTVLVIGSGLTMIDVALLLDARGFTGKIVALSRRGLLPRAHGDAGGATPLQERPPIEASALVRSIRARAAAIGWRAAVDEIRPFTQAMWIASPIDQRRRFLRHLRPWWDVHRHRLAPEVARRIEAMRERGQLEIVAGKLTGVERRADGIAVRWRPRGEAQERTMAVRRMINCSGPQGDLTRTSEPLLRNLLAAGTIRPDALHIGIDVNTQSEAIDAAGRANPHLLVLGPPTRGTFWEIVAVPDIRVQTWSVARRLSNAQWVEGEGL